MSLRASLLSQLENPCLSRNRRAELGCEIARQLEDVGDYAGAREALGEFWRGVWERPEVAGLDDGAAAEVLLRAGRPQRRPRGGLPAPGTLRALMREYEKKIIRQALRRADGSVTQAPRLLGLTHQAFIYAVEKCHPDLLEERSPKLTRRRSLARPRA